MVGILAGLLGVGGRFYHCAHGGLHPDLARGAEPAPDAPGPGTSLASIIFTSVSSFWAHHKRGAVNWTVVRRDRPGDPDRVCSRFVPGGPDVEKPAERRLCRLPLLYGVSDADQQKAQADPGLPGPLGMFGVGNGIGAVSALVGIGGGSLSVPFMVW